MECNAIMLGWASDPLSTQLSEWWEGQLLRAFFGSLHPEGLNICYSWAEPWSFSLLSWAGRGAAAQSSLKLQVSEGAIAILDWGRHPFSHSVDQIKGAAAQSLPRPDAAPVSEQWKRLEDATHCCHTLCVKKTLGPKEAQGPKQPSWLHWSPTGSGACSMDFLIFA